MTRPLALASALRELERGTHALPLPPEPALVSQSHLMIANSFRMQSGLATLFSTHPAMSERIGAWRKWRTIAPSPARGP